MDTGPCPGKALVCGGHHVCLGEPCCRPDALGLCSAQHCLLGWDIFPPKSDKSSAPKSLDLWSCVAPEAQHRKLSAATPSHQVWSQVPQEGQIP